MRVITGTARGRRIKEPANYDVRPTGDMVKEAMFSILQFDLEGRRVLDLFGGTGQLGIEAASRGAGDVTIVDVAKESVKLIRENVTHCQVAAQIVQGDSIAFLSRCGKYDIILIDPPYDSDLCEKALGAIKEFDILTEGGIMICETRREKSLPDMERPYFMRKEYRYGKVKLTVYSKETEE